VHLHLASQEESGLLDARKVQQSKNPEEHMEGMNKRTGLILTKGSSRKCAAGTGLRRHEDGGTEQRYRWQVSGELEVKIHETDEDYVQLPHGTSHKKEVLKIL
jgi:hypothetical protein